MNKSVTVEIHTENEGVKQSAKFSMQNVSELERIVIIQGVFKAINVENDLKSMVDDYVKLGKAYQEFFNIVESDPLETVDSKTDKNKKIKKSKKKLKDSSVVGNGIVNRLITAVSLTDEEGQTNKEKEDLKNLSEPIIVQTQLGTDEISNVKNTEINDESIPSFYKTGIKVTPSGNFYQCRLHCTRCKNKKTHYIRENDVTINCKFCGQVHGVRKATQEKLQPDMNNNFFVAGDFVAEHEKFCNIV